MIYDTFFITTASLSSFIVLGFIRYVLSSNGLNINCNNGRLFSFSARIGRKDESPASYDEPPPRNSQRKRKTRSSSLPNVQTRDDDIP